MKAGHTQSASPEHLSFCGGDARAVLYRSTEPTDRAVVVASGFCAVPEMYGALARELAGTGWHVVIPDLNHPLPGEENIPPGQYRTQRVVQAIQALQERTDLAHIETAGHSYGASQALRVARFMNVGAVHLVCAAGFGGEVIEDMRTVHPVRALQAYGALITRVIHQMPVKDRIRSTAPAIRSMASMARLREFVELQHPEQMKMEEHLQLVREGNIEVVTYVSPKDTIVDPAPTLRVMAGSKIISIHRNADHFAPNTHGPHVAHLLAA